MMEMTSALRQETENGSQLGEGFDGSGIRVIARAADILKTLGQHPEGLTLREIANQVNLPRSTVQRIVKALDDANFVIAASPTSGVRLGPALTLLAGSAKQIDIVQICRPLLIKLNKDCGETVDFAVLGNDKAVVVDQIPGIHRLVAVTAIGSSLPLHASASGKALLAQLPAHELASLRKRYRLVQFTKNTLRDWAALEAELAQIRRDGIAYDQEECFAGIRCVAEAICGPNGEVGAVSIPVPGERFETTKDNLVQILRRRCGTMQRRFSP
jgi:IclR family transcriptional regulator, acetate operon repressor